MSTEEKPEPATGLKRIWKAFFYSLSGFKLAFQGEAAFRQELLLVAVLTVVCLYLPLESWIKVVLLFAHVMVLVVELVNTAVESIVDMESPKFHDLAKKAKDTASAAVLLSLLFTGGLWIYALCTLT